MTHEGSEEISPGHSQFSPTLPAQASCPCQGRIGTEHSQERVAAPVTVMALQLFHATLHGLSKMMQKHKKNQPALLFAENSMLIHDSTWVKDLNFIMCFINFRVLEITYNITGSEWISI